MHNTIHSVNGVSVSPSGAATGFVTVAIRFVPSSQYSTRAIGVKLLNGFAQSVMVFDTMLPFVGHNRSMVNTADGGMVARMARTISNKPKRMASNGFTMGTVRTQRPF